MYYMIPLCDSRYLGAHLPVESTAGPIVHPPGWDVLPPPPHPPGERLLVGNLSVGSPPVGKPFMR